MQSHTFNMNSLR